MIQSLFENDHLVLKKEIPFYVIYRNIGEIDLMLWIKGKYHPYKDILYCIKLIESEECPICFEQKCTKRLKCGHFFHKECIRKWKLTKNSCPVCRKAIDYGGDEGWVGNPLPGYYFHERSPRYPSYINDLRTNVIVEITVNREFLLEEWAASFESLSRMFLNNNSNSLNNDSDSSDSSSEDDNFNSLDNNSDSSSDISNEDEIPLFVRQSRMENNDGSEDDSDSSSEDDI